MIFQDGYTNGVTIKNCEHITDKQIIYNAASDRPGQKPHFTYPRKSLIIKITFIQKYIYSFVV